MSVEGEPHEKAVELLKAALTSVKLVVRYKEYFKTLMLLLQLLWIRSSICCLARYTPKVLEEMELRFDKQRKARQRQMYS